MTIREELEAREKQTLSPHARCAADTLGRDRPMEPCPLRTAFQRDRDRIIHSKSFRRLKFKTQVFLAPKGDHYRTRLTHTLEVSQVARTLARCMRLNEDLAEAIALGHDLGHTPFGHTGERALAALSPTGFMHNRQSVRVVEVLENAGAGLNLTREVRDGILNHTGDQHPMTLEGECVRRADRIAYINHDIDDALRAGVLKPFELPAECIRLLGDTQGKRINTMIMDIVRHSEPGVIRMSDTVQAATDELRAFLFRRVYQDGWRIEEEERCTYVLRALYRYFIEHPAEMSDEYILIGYKDGSDQAVCDYLACMTDRFAMSLYERLFLPSAYPVM